MEITPTDQGSKAIVTLKCQRSNLPVTPKDANRLRNSQNQLSLLLSSGKNRMHHRLSGKTRTPVRIENQHAPVFHYNGLEIS